MSYILKILPAVPAALLVSLALYAGLYALLRKRREKPGKGRMLAEFVLVGWAVMFVYVTQILSFGNGLGERMNLVPLRPFSIAFRYGSNNASGVWQFLLNIIMFVPLGFLLPIVSEKLRNWRGVFGVSFLCTLATELLQLLTSRGTDIDDVIANTLGGLCGFALYLIGIGLVHRLRHRPLPAGHGRNLAVSLILLAVTAGVFAGLKVCDGSSPYGNLYYGHLIPQEIETEIEPDQTQAERAVYRYAEQISLNDLEEKLQSASGFSGEWAENLSNGTEGTLEDGENRRIFIFPYHTWSVYTEYGLDEQETGTAIDADSALLQAWEALKSYGITQEEVAFEADRSQEYAEGHFVFEFSPIGDADGGRTSGSVLVEMGADGRLISLSDNRIYCEYAEEASCISAADSLEIALEVGCGNWPGKAKVESVEADYTFIRQTGYLIPTWKINGTLESSDGETLEWHPEIDAVR